MQLISFTETTPNAIRKRIGFINKKPTGHEEGANDDAEGDINSAPKRKRGRPKKGGMKEASEEAPTLSKKGKKAVEVQVERNENENEYQNDEKEEAGEAVDEEVNDSSVGEVV